jgi:coenzyme F420-reducing hydrogenase alpha subunit
VYQIIDLSQKKMWIVDNNKKQVAIVSSEMMNAAEQTMEKMGKQAKTDVQKTGKSDTVNGYKCDEYTINTTGGVITMDSTQCVTNDVKADEFEPFRKYAESYVKMMGNVSTPKGVPVRTNAKISLMGQTFESKAEVQSISRERIAESTFKIPPDYKIVGAPQTNEGAQQ